MFKNFTRRLYFSGSIFFAASVLTLPQFATSYASESHTHGKGPHGGEVVEFGEKFHLEAVRGVDKISFYLLYIFASVNF